MLLSGHMNEIYALNYSPDGRLLVSASGDNTVRVWSVEYMYNDVTIQGQQHVFVINVPGVLVSCIIRRFDRFIPTLTSSPGSG